MFPSAPGDLAILFSHGGLSQVGAQDRSLQRPLRSQSDRLGPGASQARQGDSGRAEVGLGAVSTCLRPGAWEGSGQGRPDSPASGSTGSEARIRTPVGLGHAMKYDLPVTAARIHFVCGLTRACESHSLT